MKQFSKITLAIAAAASLAIASTSFAASYKGDYKGEGAMPAPAVAPCPQEKGLMDGFYIGANAGYDSYRIRQSVNIPAGAFNQNPALDATGWVGGLFAGYGQYLNSNFYLGAEIFGDISNASTTQTVNVAGANYYTNSSVKGSYGIDIVPGTKINNNTLLYLKGGYIRTRVKINETSNVPGSFGSSNSNNWQNGWNLGVGVESSFNDNWSVRTEYTHANINAFTASASQTRVTPTNNQVMLGLIYHIA